MRSNTLTRVSNNPGAVQVKDENNQSNHMKQFFSLLPSSACRFGLGCLTTKRKHKYQDWKNQVYL